MLAGFYFNLRSALTLDFPALGEGESPILTAGTRAHAGLLDDDFYSYALSAGDAPALDASYSGNAEWLCVREGDGYDSSAHHRLVGIRLDGVDSFDGRNDFQPVNLTTTAERAQTGAALTITAVAWHYNDIDVAVGRYAPSDATDEAVSARLSPQVAGMSLEARRINDEPGRREIVLHLTSAPSESGNVTATILMETALGDAREFEARIPYAATPSRTTVTATDRAAARDDEVVMEYAGARNGLDVMRSLGRVQSGQTELAPMSGGAVYSGRVCSEIEGEWRNPHPTEVAMLLSAPPAARLTAGAVRGDAIASELIAGFDFDLRSVLTLDFPALDAGETPILTAGTRAHIALLDNDKRPYALSAGTSPALDSSASGEAEWLCVRELDGYDSSAHHPLVGIRLDGLDSFDAGDALQPVNVTTTPQAAQAGVLFTITAAAWQYNDIDAAGGVVAADATGATVSVRVAPPVSGVSLETRRLNGSPGRQEVILHLTETPSADLTATILMETALGDARAFEARVPVLPPGIFRVTVTAENYGGRADGGVVMESAGTRNGLEVLRSIGRLHPGGVFVQTPPDAALRPTRSGSVFGDRLCGEIEGEWRNPKITEVAMLLSTPPATRLTAGVARANEERSDLLAGFDFDLRSVLTLDFPALAAGESPVLPTGAAAHVALVDDAAAPYALSAGSSPSLSRRGEFSESAEWLCVREAEGYDASRHHRLAGIRLDGLDTFNASFLDGLIQPVNLTTAEERSETGAALTITAVAWHYNDYNVAIGTSVPSDATDEAISVRLAPPVAGVSLEARRINDEPGRREIVLHLTALSAPSLTATILMETALGDAREFEARLPTSARRVATPDEVVAPSVRAATLDAAVGFSGAAHSVPVASGYALRNAAVTPAADGEFDAGNSVIAVPAANPVGGEARFVTLTADVECLAGRTCDSSLSPTALTVSIVLNPVAAPIQNAVSEQFLNGFSHGLNLPAGYEGGGAKSAGRTLTISGVNGWAGELANLSLSVVGDNLTYAPDGDEDNALDAGRYTITAEMSGGALLGTVTMEVAANIARRELPLAEYGVSSLPVFVPVAPGAGGNGAQLGVISMTAGADATISGAFGGFFNFALSEDNRGLTIFTKQSYSPGARQMGTFFITVTRGDPNYADLIVTTPVSVSALAQPRLLELSAQGAPYSSENIADFKSGVYDIYANGIFEKVEEGEATQLQVNRDTGVVSGNNLGEGTHTLTVDITSPDFAGTARVELRLTVVVLKLGANYELAGLTPAEPIAVAANYAGSVYAVALSDDATDGIIQLPDDVATDEFELALSSDLRTAELRLTAAAAGRDFAGAFALTVVRQSGGTPDARYAPLPQTLFATVSALSEIALAATAEVIPRNGAYAANANIHDFSDGLGDAYAGAVFGKASGANELAVSAGGVVSSASDISAGGIYQAVATATASGYLGAARMTFELTLTEEGSRAVTPDEVVAAESRAATLDAAVGFSGAAYVVPVAAGYALRNAAFTPASGGEFDADNNAIAVPAANPIGSEARALTLAADVACLTNTPCDPLSLTVSVVFNPIAAPGQDAISEVFLDGFSHGLNLPAGYEGGGAKSVGRTLTVSGVNGWAGEIANLSLSVVGDNLTYAPDGDEDNALDAGQYTITAEMSGGALLGTVTMEVAANISRAQLDPAVYALPHFGSFDTSAIPIVAGNGGNDALIGVAALSDATGATISGFTSRNFVGALTGDNRGVSIRTRSNANYAPGEEQYAAFTVTVTRGDPNYADLLVVVSVGVGPAFNPPPLLELSAQGTPTYSNANIANFSTGVYSRFAGGTFEKVEEGAATQLQVDRDTGVVSGTNLGAGTYDLTVDITSSAFVGTARVELRLTVLAAELGADYELPGLTPESPIAVAANYVGPVYEVALSDDATDAIIQLPADVVSDEFELALSGDSRTAELRLTSAAAGTDVAGAFTLTVVRQSGGTPDANYAPLPQTLFATVSALSEVALASASDVIPYNDVFTANANLHDFRTGLGGVYADAVFGKESGAAELDVSAEGVVSSNVDVSAADTYAIVATATASAYLGVARMTFELELTAEVARTVNPDEVVAAAARVAAVSAAVGYVGSVYAVPVSEGYTLQNVAFAPADDGLFDADNTIIAVASAVPVGESERTLEMAADVVCLANLPCEPLRVTLSVVLNPVLAPAQTALEATYGDSFTHSPVLPSGFESGAVLALSGSSAFELQNGNIVPAAAGGPDAGDYELQLEVTHADFLGTVTLTVTASIARVELAEGDYGLAGLTPESAITVAANYVGSVYAVALSASATDGVIQLPDDLTSDEFELALSSDFRTAELRLTAAAEGRDVAGVFTLTVVRQSGGTPDANYAPLAQTLFATVSALSEVALASASDVIPYNDVFAANANLHDFRTGLGGRLRGCGFRQGERGG